MTKRTIYTRVYSNSSAGGLASARVPEGDPLSYSDLLEDFQKHANMGNREPTALVSVSDRIVDTVKRAFDKHYVDGDSLKEIWIAFIELPLGMNQDAPRIHSGKELAEACEFREPDLFFHEFVFEWAIPEQYVLHEVSLQTLMDRGLQGDSFLQPTTEKARSSFATRFQGHSPWDIGIELGLFARMFGARAPLDWVSHQLFHDCVRANIKDEDNQVLKLHYANGHSEMVDFQYGCDLDDGIDTSLVDWWLSDATFSSD